MAGEDNQPGDTKDQNNKENNSFAAPSLSLPKGGGAVRGIGEKFAVNPATGTASFTIPVPLSPARNGFQPELSLGYDSGNGNGPFGLGWKLSLPEIRRKTSKGLPQYRGEDTFVLSGAEDLVPEEAPRDDSPEDYEVWRYRPRIEGLFARIEQWRHKGTDETHWQSISNDNRKSIYGVSQETRIVDPEVSSRIFSWLIRRDTGQQG